MTHHQPTSKLTPSVRRLIYLACMAAAIVAGAAGLLTEAAVANIGSILAGILAPGLAIKYINHADNKS